MCDHTVGYKNDFILQSEVVDFVKNEADCWNSHNKTMNALNTSDEKARKENFTGLDLLDRKQNLMTIFNNCPYCGVSIDWDEIRRRVCGNRPY